MGGHSVLFRIVSRRVMSMEGDAQSIFPYFFFRLLLSARFSFLLFILLFLSFFLWRSGIHKSRSFFRRLAGSKGRLVFVLYYLFLLVLVSFVDCIIRPNLPMQGCFGKISSLLLSVLQLVCFALDWLISLFLHSWSNIAGFLDG
ncbi:hypothetical protein BJ508DRAFT_85279 [Ascobolus immersus RN42]|uniref:Uncharacterized protein n=1 Tax=Ascobolus immersus RN42 TaxID=1160509 RepID=A0A3N4HDU9_ASCIM|nr:hypothetical protein BJ508DRAFT_85279 [Ascobolus immersus RN42]